jgi:hypothetical protein
LSPISFSTEEQNLLNLSLEAIYILKFLTSAQESWPMSAGDPLDAGFVLACPWRMFWFGSWKLSIVVNFVQDQTEGQSMRGVRAAYLLDWTGFVFLGPSC